MSNLLTELLYFHGTVDTRECRELLPEVGDFLVRNHIRENEKSDSSTSIFCVLTVAVTPDQASAQSKELPANYSLKDTCITRLKSYPIFTTSSKKTKDENEEQTFKIQGVPDKFASIQSLCDHLISTKHILPSGGSLIRSISRQPWQLLAKNIEYPEKEIVLGKGAYGRVVKAKLVREGKETIDVAVKCSTENGDAIFSDMYSEARAMRRLIHPNIIRLEGVVVEKLPILLAIEFMDGSSLLKTLQKGKVPNTMRFPIAVGILYGLLYMHTKNYIHRDIAARNVMVSHDCRIVKIIDFGLAKHGLIFNLGATQKIPQKWLAPEVKKTWTFSAKSDTWAFGVTIWEIYHNGAEPVLVNPKSTPVSKNSTTKRKKSVTGPHKKETRAPHVVISENLDHLPKQFEPLLMKMFMRKPRERIELAQMADDVEKKILPTLPKLVADAVRMHTERRPPFDPKFRVAVSIPSSDDSKKLTPKPVATAKSVTRKRKDKDNKKSTTSDDSTSNNGIPLEKEKPAILEKIAAPKSVEKKSSTDRVAEKMKAKK